MRVSIGTRHNRLPECFPRVGARSKSARRPRLALWFSPRALTRVPGSETVSGMSQLVPLNVLSAVAVLDSSLAGWQLLDVPATSSRKFQYRVVFERPFAAPPLVHLGVTGLDVSKDDNLRVRVRALDIDSDGFLIEAETWLNTKIWCVEVSWLAIGSS